MLAGYITGNTVDLAVAQRRHGKLVLLDKASYINRDYSDLESILNHYLSRHNARTEKVVLGVAGPVIDNVVITTNIPWKISGEKLAKQFSFESVQLVNDLVATARGLSELDADRFYIINEGLRQPDGNVALMAAGTGLGEAMIYYEGGEPFHFASEGGHVDFAPGNQVEIELWQYLYSELNNVEAEDVISLRGIERIYRFLIDTQRCDPSKGYHTDDDKPSRIIEMALAGTDKTAVRAIDIFIDCYASEAANLALKGMALGGVFLAGLLAPQIMTLLDRGRFMERFTKKGKLSKLLARTPVSLILEEKTALLGAAAVAVDTDLL